MSIAVLERLLADESVEEIWLNSPEKVFAARNGRAQQIACELSDRDVELWVERLLMPSQRRLDKSNPFVDATLPDGSRLHVAIPDVVRRHWAVNIRKFVARLDTLAHLVARGVMPESTALLLEACVIAGYNIVVAGGTGAGKTTLLNCLLAAVPAEQRLITCEEVFELSVQRADAVSLQTRLPNLEGAGEVTVRELVRQSLRMRPERLVVGEVRSAESFDLLLALNSGQPGMATIHANSAREAVLKLCTLPLLAGENVSADFVVPTVAAAVDLVVQVDRDHTGRRRVVEVGGLTGRVVGGVPELQQLMVFKDGDWRIVGSDLPKSDVRRGPINAARLWSALAEPELDRVA